MLEEEYLEAVH